MPAMIWMLGSLVSFSLLAIAVRELSGDVSIPQILFFRSFIGLLCLSAVIGLILLKDKQKKPCEFILTQRLGTHTFRAIVHFLGQCGWCLGIVLLPLAQVFALEFTMPIWALLFSLLFLGEVLTLRKASAIIVGMLGVFIIVEPNYSFDSLASFIVLAAAICYAMTHACTKLLSTTDNAITILFYSCLLQMPFALSLSLSSWTWPSAYQMWCLVVVSLSALIAHYCLSKAMIHGSLSQMVTLDFLRLPIIGILGVVLYNEGFTLNLIIGAIFMFIANGFILWPRFWPKWLGKRLNITLTKIPH